MTSAALSAAGLTRRFGDRVAVEDVSLDLEPGQVLALLGPNGAGKTTTLRLLCGLLAPSAGTVSVGGDALTAASGSRLRRQIGLLTEAPGLWDRLTVRENLLVYARLYGLAPPDAAVDAALAPFDLGTRADEPAARLSKGLRQRVALARCLLHDPRIVLLDEPTSGLDPESARDVRALVIRLRDSGRAVLLSTHNLDEVQRVADRVAVLRTRLVALDTPAALRAQLFDRRVRVVLTEPAGPFAAPLAGAGFSDVTASGREISVGGGTSAAGIPALVRALVEAGASIESVTPEEPSLEEVYLRLVHGRPRPS